MRNPIASSIASSLLTLLAVAACNGGSDDPIDDVPYPACTGATQQCLDQFPVVGSRTVPIYRNVSLATANPAITQAVIVVHGSSRDANNFFYSVMTAAEQDGVDQTTAVVAPHFECDDDNPASGEAYWTCEGATNWSHGGADVSGASAPIYSYAVMDQLVSTLADKQVFPNLQRIVVTGMGGGGQLVERYGATTAMALAGVTVAYAPVSPSSYLWLDATRPVDTAGCSDYDDYPYGMTDRNGYVATPSASLIAQQLVARDVTFFVGGEDTLANAAGTDMDTSCEANTQGVDRLARATNFHAAITAGYGATHPLVVVAGCMSSRSCMYFAPEVRATVFGEATSD